MVDFKAHPDCRLCPLWEQAANPGIPTRAADCQEVWPKHPRALLVVGQNPGQNEDQQNKSWVGWAGDLTNRIVRDILEAPGYVDAYLANAARCRTPGNKPPQHGPCNKCRPYLLDDIRQLVAEYGASNVYILAMGAPAAWTLTGDTIRKAILHQGSPVALRDADDLPPLPVFYTYHPAATAPGRNPSLLQPMEDHLRLLKDAMQGKLHLPTLPSDPRVAVAGFDPVTPPPVVAIDIETYGIIKGRQEQTVFHPARMGPVDRATRDKIVVRVALGWRGTEGIIQTSTYRWSDHRHRRALVSALRSLPRGTILSGQNLVFDLSVLRFVSLELRQLLVMDRFALDDNIVLNHLDADMRPERSLKSVSTLLRTMDYMASPVNPKRRLLANSDTDRNLIIYNAADVVATLRNRDQHLANIRRQHGAAHPVFTDRGRQFRSDLLWVVLDMTEAGQQFDTAALHKLHVRKVAEAQQLMEEAYAQDLIVAGKGSGKSTTAAVTEAAMAAGLLDDYRLALTAVKKEVATKKDNIHLLLSVLPLDSPLRRRIQLIEDYRRAQKIFGTYTGPLLHEPARGLVAGRSYSSWYPVPAYVKDASGAEGGTRQGRFAAKDPPAQTFPPIVSACCCSRYGAEGSLLSYDESQMELRMAALLSGDPAMMEAYELGLDIHHETALVFWPDLSKDAANYNDRRQVGKKANFLSLYLGGAWKLVESIRKEIGLELNIDEARAFLAAFSRKYNVFRQWQTDLIQRVVHDGYLVLPTGWKRTFLGGERAAADTYSNEIVNAPVQCLSAQCLQSAHAMILRDFRGQRLAARIGLQIHDSLYVDVHRSVQRKVDSIVRRWMTYPPLWLYLQELHKRTLPLVVDCKRIGVGSK